MLFHRKCMDNTRKCLFGVDDGDDDGTLVKTIPFNARVSYFRNIF